MPLQPLAYGRGPAYAPPDRSPSPLGHADVADEAVAVAATLTAALLRGALIASERDGDHVVCDLGRTRYRLDVREAVRAAGGNVVVASRRGAALVRAVCALVAPGRPTAPWATAEGAGTSPPKATSPPTADGRRRPLPTGWMH